MSVVYVVTLKLIGERFHTPVADLVVVGAAIVCRVAWAVTAWDARQTRKRREERRRRATAARMP